MTYADLLDRVRDAAASLDKEEAADVHHALDIVRRVRNEPGCRDIEHVAHDARVQLQRLAELLGRRGSHALPAASLARAALADLAGDERQAEALRKDCDAKLLMLGL